MPAQADRIALPAWDRLPDIGLYMDQVITLLDRTFSPALPKGEMTKSMVNNYVKVGMLPRPVGKKYEREHLALLMMISVLKQALSMDAVSDMLTMFCQPDVQTGYTRFLDAVETIERSMDEDRVALGESPSPEARAMALGVLAALCTIRAKRQLSALRVVRAPGA